MHVTIRNIIFVFLATLFSSLVYASSVSQLDGPFGFKIGDQVSPYKQCQPYKPFGYYFCKNAPKGIPEALYYEVVYNKSTGICAISAEVLLQNHALGSYGVEEKIAEFTRQLDIAYGSHRKGDEYSVNIWDKKSAMTPRNGIEEVYITPPSEAPVGEISRLQFNSEKFSECLSNNDREFKEKNRSSDTEKANKF